MRRALKVALGVGGNRVRENGIRFAEAYPPLAGLLVRTEAAMSRAWEQGEGFLSVAAQGALLGRGKRLRPSVLLLSAECVGGATDSTVALAAVVELVHAASLIHDDVVDEAPRRRGRRSANAMWGSKVSVLLGDYLIARALELLPVGERERLVPALARVAASMCSGQIAELTAAGRPVPEAQYVEIARSKTGSLFGFCGQVGAETAGADASLAAALSAFAERFGVAFQFADDILDLVGTDGQSGKPEGTDLTEGKFTLPLILAAKTGGAGVCERLEEVVCRGPMSEADLRVVRELVESAGAIEAAWDRVRAWLDAAREQLECVPDSAARSTLAAACGELFPMPVMAEER
jgi:geranylgeranyl pyrophosphate synthase